MTELEPSTMVTGTTDIDPCPCCGTTSGVQPMPAPPKVDAWTCTACGLNWAISVIRPDSRAAALLTDLGATAQEIGRLRRTLRQLCTLADQAPTITNEQLRDRLTALADSCAR